MPSMSYCRFENCADDLRDCVGAMEDAYNLSDMDISASEFQSMKSMYRLCNEFIDQYERLIASEEYADEVDPF